MDEARASHRSVRRRLDEFAETQQWVHHVGDLGSGELLTTLLERPVAPLSRAQRLSRFWPNVDPDIFGRPRYRLTPRSPFQAAPEASLIVSRCTYSATDNEVIWQPSPNASSSFDLGGLRAFFAESPQGRCVVSIVLSGVARPGAVGHISIQETQSTASVRIPITGVFSTHAIDLTFVPRVGQLSDILLSLEAGIELLTFRSITFGVEPLVFEPIP
jgi:hypothetical protein